MRRLIAALALALIGGAAQAQPVPQWGYARDARTCDGYPRALIETAKGICAGIVLAPPPAGLPPSKRTLHMPRTLLALPGGDWLVVDLGTWDPGRGTVWRLTPRPGGEPVMKRVLSKHDLPHTLAWYALALLVTGGVLYSTGVIFYVNKRLKFSRAIWHGHVVAAAAAHWAAVLTGVVLASQH